MKNTLIPMPNLTPMSARMRHETIWQAKPVTRITVYMCQTCCNLLVSGISEGFDERSKAGRPCASCEKKAREMCGECEGTGFVYAEPLPATPPKPNRWTGEVYTPPLVACPSCLGVDGSCLVKKPDPDGVDDDTPTGAELDFFKGALEQIAKECPHKETAERIRNALWQLEQRLKEVTR